MALGLILHQITPGILGGMKFDFLIIFIVTSILINPSKKNTILTGLLGGLLSALTTSFPGGQLANIIDKLITVLFIYLVLSLIRKEESKVFVYLLGMGATLVSGISFLTSAMFLVGLPLGLGFLIVSVVVPTSLINGFGTVFIYQLVKKSIRLGGIEI